MAVTILAVLCSCDLFSIGKTLGSMGVASQAYLRAGKGVVLGAVFLGEYIAPVIWFGFITAILGVAVINTPVHIK
jgi:EamA domain-containing membrane protein RarD